MLQQQQQQWRWQTVSVHQAVLLIRSSNLSTYMQWPTLGSRLVGMVGAQIPVGAPMMHVSCKPMFGADAGAGAGPVDLAKWPSSSCCISLQPLRTLAILLRRIAGGAARSSTTQLVLVLIFLAAGCHLGLNAVLITVCLLALPTVVFCWSFCTARPRSRLQVWTDRGCIIM